MPRRPPLGLLLAPLLLLALPGCAETDEPVAVSLPSGRATQTPGCASLHGHLPQLLPQGLERRATTPSSPSTAAWGDPPVTLRCGVAPGSVRDELYTFNRLEWAMHDTGGARRWTTRGLRTNVEVLVPDAYSSQAELVGSLSRLLLEDLGR